MSDGFKIQCKSCQSVINAKAHHIGKTVACPKCKAPIDVRPPIRHNEPNSGVQPAPPPRVKEQSRIDQTSSATIMTRERTVATDTGQSVVATQVVVQNASNQLGVAGFVTSIIGLFSCGVLSPIALILSLIALSKSPRGMAIAGTVLGCVGIIPMVLFAIPFVIAIVALPHAAEAVRKEAEKIQTTQRESSKESLEMLTKVAVTDAKITTEINSIGRPKNYIQLTVTNGLSIPIRRLYFFVVTKEPGRTIPIISDSFNYEPPGGIEPNEIKELTLSPNMFSDLGKREVPKEAITVIMTYRVDGANGKMVYEAEDLVKKEMNIQ